MKVNQTQPNAQAQAAQQRKPPVAPRQTQQVHEAHQAQQAQQTHEAQAAPKHTKLKVGVKVDVQA